MVLDKNSGFGWKNKQKALLSLVLMQFFEFQDYVIFNAQNPHEFVSNSKTQVIFYLWVSRDMGSRVSGARKEVAVGTQGPGVFPQLGSHFADLSLPCSLPLPAPTVVWTEHHPPSTPALLRPRWAGMLFTCPTPAFPWALCHSAAFGKKQVKGEDVLSLWKMLEPFCPRSFALVTTVPKW